MSVSTIDHLYQLQRIDSRLTQLGKEMATLDDGASARGDLERLQAENSATATNLHARQSELRKLELELQSTVAKARKVETDLYSGRVGNPKELSAMQEDIQVLTRQQQRLEDEILAIMEDVERLQEEVRAQEISIAATQQRLTTHLELFESRQNALAAEIQRVQAERAASVAAIDETLIRRYELLRERKGGVAVTLVVRGICEGCHVAIPEHRLAQLLDPETVRIYTCEGCGRILHAKAS